MFSFSFFSDLWGGCLFVCLFLFCLVGFLLFPPFFSNGCFVFFKGDWSFVCFNLGCMQTCNSTFISPPFLIFLFCCLIFFCFVLVCSFFACLFVCCFFSFLSQFCFSFLTFFGVVFICFILFGYFICFFFFFFFSFSLYFQRCSCVLGLGGRGGLLFLFVFLTSVA